MNEIIFVLMCSYFKCGKKKEENLLRNKVMKEEGRKKYCKYGKRHYIIRKVGN